MIFTQHQMDAVDIEKRHLDACVVAGPGSGKTTVLVKYFERLVTAGVDPLRILAITFTEKAAGNMRKKLAEVFHERPEDRARLERAWVSTVHGFCARLLKENAVLAGVDPEFTVADERESWRLQKESMTSVMEALFAEHRAGMRALIRGLSSYEFEEAVRSAYDAMRGAGVLVEELAGYAPPQLVTRAEIAETLRELRADRLSNWSYAQKEHLQCVLEGAGRIVDAATPLAALHAIEAFTANLNSCKRGASATELVRRLKDHLVKKAKYLFIGEYYTVERGFLLDILRRFDHLYRERKRLSGSLDFADLEEFAVRLLDGSPETRARLQSQFDHILMDEFQDTNPQQARLLELVRRPDRFYAVGDINQSIFGFRHAEPLGFAEYRDDVERRGRRLVGLTDNFRSRPEILSAVETITDGLPGIESRTLTAGRAFDNPRPVCVEVLAAVEPEIEAPWVAGRILELVETKAEFAFRNVAVLVRNTEVIGGFTTAFEQAGIPYVVNRGRGFYDAREVNDLTQLLRAIANPRDEIALAAVLRSPLVEVSDEALLRLKILGDNLGGSLMRLTDGNAPEFDADDFRKLSHFRDQLRLWRLRREYVSFDRLLVSAMDDCGYRPESGSRGEANIDKFLAQAREASGRMSLDQFVEDLAWVREENPREVDAPPEDSADAVQIMTVHSAKGLEFPVVFVAALNKGVKNDLPVVAFSPRIGLGARWRNPAKREDKDDLYQHAIREERKEREKQESNRLFYVAMTRAEQLLVLSFSASQLKEWAGVVAERLHLDLSEPGDEVVACVAPDGKAWKLRVVVANHAPLTRSSRLAQEGQDGSTQELLPLPEVTGQQDGNATVTALSLFANCPREYFLGRYLGFEGRQRKLAESENGGDLPASEFGTQVHALLAGTAVANPDPEALRLADVFRQSPLGRRVARASRVEREFDFLMAVDDLVIRGQVDLWFEEGGELAIVDYKTDAVTAVEAHQRAGDYGMQLRLYALAIERLTGRPPRRAWLHFLRPNTAIEMDLAPSLLESPEQLVRDFQEAQDKRNFPLREGERCRRCPFFRDLCPSTFVP